MIDIISFADRNSTRQDLIGGKAANLARLTQGGFDVPAGFTVTTQAYERFMVDGGLDRKIPVILSGIEYDRPDSLERATSSIRDLILDTPVPADLAEKIEREYRGLGEGEIYVAVRSSGAAEDLAEASFAGLHDTYLDIQGVAAVIDAVKRCWASLWTARATSYRQLKQFNHLKAPIAVVVQAMVESEVAGVLFTGNPMNAANDELVVNASWGLGEAIVGGITTPDEFTVKAGSLRIIERKLGSKAVRVVRNRGAGGGTVSEAVPESERSRFCLSDEQVAELAALGQRIERHYEGFPQDIEWGYAKAKFYVLQARPITGVEFSWDVDVNACVPSGEVPDDQLWSRALSDEGWAGACTPLMYSWRGLTLADGHSWMVNTAGYPHLNNTTARSWFFWKGKVYYNADQDRGFIEDLTPPLFRPMLVSRLPSDWRSASLAAPFDHMKYINMYVRYHTMAAHAGLPWITTPGNYLATRQAEHDGLPPEALRSLSDDEVKTYVNQMFDQEMAYTNDVWGGLVLFMRDAICLLYTMIGQFYKGANANVATDLLTGSPRRCATARENVELFEFAVRIRESKTLSALFSQAERADEFFGRLKESEDGRRFSAAYDDFVARHGHRGHSDRDIYFLRRAENPSVDFLPLKSLLSTDVLVHPETMEHKVNERREAARADVIANFQGQPFGGLKVEVFKLVFEYVHECLISRDDERHFLDRSTFAIKRGYTEIGRRLVERGVLESDRDYFFLTQGELYALLDGEAPTRLLKSKIAARMRDFDRVNDKLVSPPLFMRRGLPITLDKPVYGEGVFHGTATSRGVVTGTARIVKSLSEIPSVREGEIIVVNATDPGWTPVFMIIRGIVLETGGMLAHGSLLAREYGFPAVQVEDAMQHIPDGATITVDGDAGVVTIVKAPTRVAAAQLVEAA